MSERERLDNVLNFINNTIIYPGYGYEYKEAIQLLISGYSYDSIFEWYQNKIVKQVAGG